ncbi:MAG: NAD(P)-dependent oxidoreductase [Armatimonadota bacterium]|nr:NAD(P)-dependent oxidoreductase [Armatimonadota bacterium]MDR7486343.1 NAD(P)-dependent oxidoreductase [Armatimonadota bacterium]MDR7534220.1 NAD(P)-dependent oxidoreductase [Armatimonadota bacterium]MDR7536764.1 NAD(P)-dependent oxidoreductase [Armatimonadota bacterium]
MNDGSTLRVTVLGLGLMGRPMARRLAQAGFDVRGWNRSPLAPDLVAGIRRCATLAEAADADVCLLMLADSAATDAVLERLDPHLRAGQLVLDMGSSDPTHSVAHAARLAARGIGWVDAPVSGGPEGARTGTLAIMVGGEAADVARVRPVLEALGGNVVHVGGPGSGHTTKVINQVIVALTIEAVAEALTLAERCGLDPRRVQEALRGGFADSKVLQIHGTRMIARDYTPGGRAALQLKDLRMAQALARQAGLVLPHLESAVARYEQVVARGDGNLDHSVVHRLLWV